MAGDQGEYGSFPVQNDQQSSRRTLASETPETLHAPSQESPHTAVAQGSSSSPLTRHEEHLAPPKLGSAVPNSSQPATTGSSVPYDPPQNRSLSPSAQYEVGRNSVIGSTITGSDYGDFPTTPLGGNSEVNYATRFPAAGSRQGDYSLPRAKATNYGSSQPKSPSIMEAAIAPSFSPPPPPPSDHRTSYRDSQPFVAGQGQYSSQTSQRGSDFAPAPSYVTNRDSMLGSFPETVKSDTKIPSDPPVSFSSHPHGISNASGTTQPQEIPFSSSNHALAKEHYDVRCDDMDKDQQKHITSDELQSEEKPKSKRRKWIIIGIVVSILLIGGAVGGGVGGKIAHDKAHAHDPKPDGATCDISYNSTQCINYCSSTTETCQRYLSVNDQCQDTPECSSPLICSHGQCRNKSTSSSLLPVYQGSMSCTNSQQCQRGLHCLSSSNTIIANSGSGYCGWQGCITDGNCYGDEYFCQSNITSCGLLTCSTTSNCIAYLNAKSEPAYAAVATCTADSFYSTVTSICSLAFPSPTATSSV